MAPTWGDEAEFGGKIEEIQKILAKFEKERAGTKEEKPPKPSLYKIAMEMVEDGDSLAQICQRLPEIAFKHLSSLEKLIKIADTEDAKGSLKQKFAFAELREWQAELLAEVSIPLEFDSPAGRLVRWYYDPLGNAGKTYMASYLNIIMDSCALQNGKSSDMAHIYNNETIITIDCTRSAGPNAVNYDFIESLSGNIIMSSKYDSMNKYRVSDAYIIVFANFMPDKSRLSLDRWDIRTLEKNRVIKREQGGPQPIEVLTSSLNHEIERFNASLKLDKIKYPRKNPDNVPPFREMDSDGT